MITVTDTTAVKFSTQNWEFKLSMLFAKVNILIESICQIVDIV